MAAAKKKKTIPFSEATQTDPFASDLVKEISKIGGETVYRDHWEKTNYVHSGSLEFDRVLGGGVPRGIFMQIAGKSSYGKGSILLMYMRQRISDGARCAWVDMEKKFPVDYAARAGIYVDGPKRNLLLLRPVNVEDSHDIINTLLDKNAIDDIGYDSIGGSLAKAEEEGDAGDNHMMRRARLWAKFAPQIATKLEIRQATLIALNQYTVNASPMDRSIVYPGGYRKDHACTVIVTLRKPEPIWRTANGDIKIASPPSNHMGKSGIVIQAKVAKNHTAPTEGMTAKIDVRFRPSIRVAKADEVLKYGREYGVFTKEDGSPIEGATAWHYYDGKKIGKSSDVLHNLLEQKLLPDVIKQIRESMEADR